MAHFNLIIYTVPLRPIVDVYEVRRSINTWLGELPLITSNQRPLAAVVLWFTGMVICKGQSRNLAPLFVSIVWLITNNMAEQK